MPSRVSGKNGEIEWKAMQVDDQRGSIHPPFIPRPRKRDFDIVVVKVER